MLQIGSVHCIKYAKIRVFTDSYTRIRTESLYERIWVSGNPYFRIFYAVVEGPKFSTICFKSLKIYCSNALYLLFKKILEKDLD